MFRKSILLTACAGLSLAALGQTLHSIQERSTNIPLALGSGMPVGVWSGGAIVFVENSRSAAPVVVAFDRNGQKAAEFTLAIPGASLIKVHSGQFTRGSDGSFAIAGHAYTTDSRGTSFVAWVSADGTHQTVIRMTPYLVYSIAMASDGTIWTAGGIETPSQSSYDLVRRFDRDGKLLGSMIPSGSLNVTDIKRFVDPASNSFLAASATNVAWYSEAAQVYILFGPDGSEISRIATSSPAAKMTLHGLALCDNGKAYIGAQLHSFVPDGNGAGAIPIMTDGSAPPFIPLGHATLYGCDGSSLVAHNGHSSFAWYHISGDD